MTKPRVDKGTGGALTREDCLALGEKVLSQFTSDELKDYVSKVFSYARNSSLKGQAAIDEAMKSVNDEELALLFNDCARKAQNTAIYEERAKAIQDGNAELRQYLDYRIANRGNSIVAAQRSARSRLANTFFDETFSREEESFAFDDDNYQDIMNALDGKDASPMAKKVAARTDKYREQRNADSVSSGYLSIEHLSKYKYLDHNHDVSKMVSGGANFAKRARAMFSRKETKIEAKKSWVEFILPKLDLEAMFEGSKGMDDAGNLNMEYIQNVLENTYENITTGKSDIFTKSIVANDREAVKKKLRMFLLFKDWSAWGEYNAKYGKGNFLEALLSDIGGSGGKIGMAEAFGDSPLHMFNDLTKVQQKVGFDKPAYETDRSYQLKNELTFSYLMRGTPASVRPGLTEFISGVKSLTSAIRLLNVPILSLPDQAHGVEFVGRFATNRFKNFGYFLANTFNNKLGHLAFPERKEVARQLKFAMDAHLGYLFKATSSHSVGQFLSRVSSKTLKRVGMTAADNGNKLSAMSLISTHLGKLSSTPFDRLPEPLIKQLNSFNISAREWDLLRKKTKVFEGKKLFCLDNVNHLTDEELREFHAGSESKLPLTQLRNDLYRKVYSMFDVASENTIISPGTFTRANIYGMNFPGSLPGEFWGMVNQFKQYPIDYMDRVWNQGMQNADGMMPKTAFAIRMMIVTLPLAFMSTWLGLYAKGKSLPDMDDPKFWASMALPGAGVFLSVLDHDGGNGNMLFNLLRSPSLGLAQNMTASALAAIHGDKNAAKKKFSKAVRSILPIDTIPFLSPFLRQALGDEPYLEKGQRQIYGA